MTEEGADFTVRNTIYPTEKHVSVRNERYGKESGLQLAWVISSEAKMHWGSILIDAPIYKCCISTRTQYQRPVFPEVHCKLADQILRRLLTHG